MALTTNLSVAQSLSSATLAVNKSGNSVESITYSNINKQVTFDARPDITLTLSEMLDFISQVNVFQTAILFNYDPNVFATIPFGSCNTTENHDSGLSKWSLVCIYGSSPRVCNYMCDIPTKMVDLINRANSKTIDLPEWIYFLIQLNHFRNSLKAL